MVSTLVVEWIEMIQRLMKRDFQASPPSWWSGLKSVLWGIPAPASQVSTLVVEWIEIRRIPWRKSIMSVSTLVVEWIEI